MTNDELIAQLLATAQPRTMPVRVCARGDLVARHGVLVLELADAQKRADGSIGGDRDVDRIAGEIVALEAEQEAATVEIEMHSVGRKTWADLLKEHPPRKEDKGLDHNPDTYPAAMVALCAGIPLEQAQALETTLHVGEWNKLWTAGLVLNITETPHPKLPAATDLVRANEPSSTTPGNAASLEGLSSVASAAR